MYACSECNNQNTLICNKCTGYINESTKPSRFEAGKQIPINVKFAENDVINHPQHYTAGRFEVIDYIADKLTGDQFEGYCIGNVLKYVSRYRHKGGYQDLKKAVWYLDKLIDTANKD